MPDSFADSISLPRKRLVMAVLLVIMLVMAITAGGSLWLVVNEARQLGREGGGRLERRRRRRRDEEDGARDRRQRVVRRVHLGHLDRGDASYSGLDLDGS